MPFLEEYQDRRGFLPGLLFLSLCLCSLACIVIPSKFHYSDEEYKDLDERTDVVLYILDSFSKEMFKYAVRHSGEQ